MKKPAKSVKPPVAAPVRAPVLVKTPRPAPPSPPLSLPETRAAESPAVAPVAQPPADTVAPAEVVFTTIAPLTSLPGKDALQSVRKPSGKTHPTHLQPKAPKAPKVPKDSKLPATPPKPNSSVTHIGAKRRKTLRKIFAEWIANGRPFPPDLLRSVASQTGCRIPLICQTLEALGADPALLDRATGFAIEQLYLELGPAWTQPLDDLIEEISRRTGLRQNLIFRWIKLLGRMPPEVRAAPRPTPEQQQEILAHYQTYLTGSTPPPLPLHRSIAAAMGEAVTPAQVHQVLVRHRFWRSR